MESSALSTDVSLLEGPLKFKNNSEWKLYYWKQIKTDDPNPFGKLFYFTDANSSVSVGFIDLTQILEVVANSPQIELRTAEKSFVLEVVLESGKEFEKWIDGINNWRSLFLDNSALNGILKVEDGKTKKSRFVRQEKSNLCFYKSQKDTSKLFGYIDLTQVSDIQKEKGEFALVSADKTVRFAGDKKQIDYWIDGLTAVINLQKNIKQRKMNKQIILPDGSSFEKSTSASSQESLMEPKVTALSSFLEAFGQRKMDFEINVHIMEAEDLFFKDVKNQSDVYCEVQILNKK